MEERAGVVRRPSSDDRVGPLRFLDSFCSIPSRSALERLAAAPLPSDGRGSTCMGVPKQECPPLPVEPTSLRLLTISACLLSALTNAFTLLPAKSWAAWASVPVSLTAAYALSSQRRSLLGLVIALQAGACGLGLQGALVGPGVSERKALVSAASLSFAVWLLLAGPFTLHVAFSRRYPTSLAAPLVFPAAWTAAWGLLAVASPLGSFASPAASLAEGHAAARAVVQLASVFGADAIVFLLAWPGAAAATALAASLGLLHCPADVARTAQLRHGQHALLAAACVALCAGAGTQRIRNAPSIATQLAAAPPLRASCVFRVQDWRDGSFTPASTEDALWRATAARVAAGDTLVLWSEAAVAVAGKAGEAALLEKAASVVRSSRSYLGIAYEVMDEGITPATLAASRRTAGGVNAFALLHPPPPNAPRNASLVAFRLLKRNPVPVVEAGVHASPERALPVEHAPFGTTAAVICFDADFPFHVAQAGAAGADVLLQPSQTWGSQRFRTHHFAGNGLRAVENGLTLLRCAAHGISGGVGPRLERLAWAATEDEGTLLMALPDPRRARVWTPYSHGGWLFLPACGLGAAAAAAALARGR